MAAMMKRSKKKGVQSITKSSFRHAEFDKRSTLNSLPLNEHAQCNSQTKKKYTKRLFSIALIAVLAIGNNKYPDTLTSGHTDPYNTIYGLKTTLQALNKVTGMADLLNYIYQGVLQLIDGQTVLDVSVFFILQTINELDQNTNFLLNTLQISLTELQQHSTTQEINTYQHTIQVVDVHIKQIKQLKNLFLTQTKTEIKHVQPHIKKSVEQILFKIDKTLKKLNKIKALLLNAMEQQA